MSSDDALYEALKAADYDAMKRADVSFIVTFHNWRVGDCEWAGATKQSHWTLQVVKSRATNVPKERLVIPEELARIFLLLGEQIGTQQKWVVCFEKVKPRSMSMGVPKATMPSDFVETSMSGMVNALADEVSKLAAKKKF